MKKNQRVQVTNGDLQKWNEKKLIVYYVFCEEDFVVYRCTIRHLLGGEALIVDLDVHNCQYKVFSHQIFESESDAIDKIIDYYINCISDNMNVAQKHIEMAQKYDCYKFPKWIGLGNRINNKINYKVIYPHKGNNLTGIEVIKEDKKIKKNEDDK